MNSNEKSCNPIRPVSIPIIIQTSSQGQEEVFGLRMPHEVIHMEKSDSESRATAKQVAYIQTLKRDLGEKHLEIIEGELSIEKASAVIDGLLSKVGRNGVEIKRLRKINEPRLGMAMKECFKVWRKYCRDIYETKRERFKKEVIETYWLFTEIAEALEQTQRKVADKGHASRGN